MLAEKSKKSIQYKIQQTFFKKYLAGIGLVIILAILWYVVYFQPMQSSVSNYAKNVNMWQQKIKEASTSNTEITQLEINVDFLKEEIAKIEKKIFHLGEMENIAQELISFAKTYRLKVLAMEPQYDILFPVNQDENTGKLLVKLPLKLKMTGRYISAGKFLDDVGKLPFIFSPDEVSIDADVLMYPQLHITIEGYLFLVNDDKIQANLKNNI